MRLPGIYTALRAKFANVPKSPETKPVPAPERPTRVRAPATWPQGQGRVDQETAAIKKNKELNAPYIAWAKRALQAPAPLRNAQAQPAGKTAVQADIDKARGNRPPQGQAREQGPVPQAQAQAQEPKDKAGVSAVRADFQKARESVTARQSSQDKGRGR